MTQSNNVTYIAKNDQRLLNLKPSRETENDYPVTLSRSLNIAPLPKNASAFNPDEVVRDQGRYGACVGFGITDAFHHQLVMQDYRWINRPLSPMFVWTEAKQNDEWQITTALAGADGTSIKAGLDVVRKRGNLYESFAPYGYITYYDTPRMYSDAAFIRAAAYYNLRSNARTFTTVIENICRWIGMGRQVVIGISVYDDFMNAGVTGDTPRGNALGGHCCRLIAYDNYSTSLPFNTVFTVGNSWGAQWGVNGKITINANYLKNVMFEAYGIDIPQIPFYD